MVEFKFSQLDEKFSEPELSNTEKAMLRPFAEPGGPLWKIVRKMTEYGRGLQQGLVTADMDSEDDRKAARKIQATIIAIGWTQEQFENELSDIPEFKEEEGATDVDN